MESFDFLKDPGFVHFIEDVVIRKMPPTKVVEYAANAKGLYPSWDKPGPEIRVGDIKKIDVPVFDLHKRRGGPGDEETLTAYIAVSMKVERLLGMPFKDLKESNGLLRKKHKGLRVSLRKMGLLDRIRFLFRRHPLQGPL